jgi:hypothetical protein
MALNHYSHYRNSTAATEMFEIVSPALFEVYFTFPTLIKNTYGMNSELMFEHVRSVSGLDGVTPTVGNVVQKFKFAERHYAAAGPDRTSLELTITYTMNINDAHQNYIYNMLRKWYNLIYNPHNGQMLTKKQYAGGSILTILEHDRAGEIWRAIKCKDFFPSTPPTGLNEDSYDNMGDAKTVTITFIVDDWVDITNGLKTYNNPAGLDYEIYDGSGSISKSSDEENTIGIITNDPIIG